MKPKKVVFRVVVSTGVAIGSVIAASSWFWYDVIRSQVSQLETLKVQIVGGFVAGHITDTEDTNRFIKTSALLMQVKDPMSQSRLFSAVEIIDKTGTIITSQGIKSSLDYMISAKNSSHTVNLYFNTSFIQQNENDTHRKALAAIIAVLLISVLSVTYTSRALSHLTSLAHRLLHFDSTRSQHITVSCEYPSVEVIQVISTLNSLIDRVQNDKKLLEHRVQSRTRDLQSATDNAKLVSKAKSEFLANMSHEIRTPMNAIVGLSELAVNQETNPRTRDYLRKISESSNTLMRILNDILDFSKIEADLLELECQDFSLRDVLDRLTDLFRFEAAEKHLEFVVCVSTECRYVLYGDPSRIGQVLLNLISNAIKFTDEGEVELRSESTVVSGNVINLLFSVRDTGIGMTNTQMDRLFTAFTQADTSTTRKYGGTGLGLTLSKRLVSLMGGEIWVESRPGCGSTFFIQIPVTRRATTALEMDVPSDLVGKRCLIIDDSVIANQALTNILSMLGFVCESVTDTSGIPSLMGHKFDLILVDQFIPHENTLFLTRDIRGRQPQAKIILLTQNVENVDIQETGADDYIDKPVGCSSLFDTVMRVFGKTAPKQLLSNNAISLEYVSSKIGGSRILVVEDRRVNQQIAVEMLKSVGIHVFVADNGRECLSMVAQHHFDAILMDLQMPVMDGHTAVRYLKSDPRTQNIPVIAMTAHVLTEDKDQCLQEGMVDHIGKPINKDKLYTSLLKHVPHTENPVCVVEASPSEYRVRNIRGVDVGAAVSRINGNHNMFFNILQTFAIDFNNFRDVVGPLIRVNDVNAIRQHIHALKGAAGNIAANEIHEMAINIETQLRNGQTPDLDPLFRDLENLLTIIWTIPAPSHEQHTIGNIMEVVQSLKAQILRSNMDSLESFAQVRDYLADGPDKTMLTAQLYNLDFESAAHTLSRMIDNMEVGSGKDSTSNSCS